MTTHHEDTAEHGTTDDVGELDEASARHALDIACTIVDLPTDRAELIRIGSNAVFRIAHPHRVIARVARSIDNLAEARKQVDVSRWLHERSYPATRALPLDQPVVAAGRVVTFWESASDREDYAPIGDVAHLIRHGATPTWCTR